MLDYKLLQALTTVIESGGFERAGQELGLSQSAVSQRIKLLESRLGQPVLTRHPHLQATAIGRRLLNHAQQVNLLERDLSRQIPELSDNRSRLRIALNADSLATWWGEAVSRFSREQGLLLDLVIEDQDVGLRRMREGDVAACLCSSATPVAGARCVPVGRMLYHALATQEYVAKYFPDGLTESALSKAPVIIFGPHDQLQQRFLSQCGYYGGFPYHLCPSSEGFLRLTMAGLGYGMIPDNQVKMVAPEGSLACLANDQPVTVDLYWHYWRHSGPFMEKLTRALTNAGAEALEEIR